MGKTALITGAASGIGLATARRFAAEGAFVIMADRDAVGLEASVRSLPGRGRAEIVDVADIARLETLFSTIAGRSERLDILFANAGTSALASIDQVSETLFDAMFAVNVKGVFFTVQKALPLLTDGGAIILNASIQTVKGFPDFSLYAASKAAVRSFARGWTNELRQRHIRVNVVSPGHIDTPLIPLLAGSEQRLRAYREEVASAVPLGREGTADEIARAVTFLASDDASYIAGVELFVDGGVAQI